MSQHPTTGPLSKRTDESETDNALLPFHAVNCVGETQRTPGYAPLPVLRRRLSPRARGKKRATVGEAANLSGFPAKRPLPQNGIPVPFAGGWRDVSLFSLFLSGALPAYSLHSLSRSPAGWRDASLFSLFPSGALPASSLQSLALPTGSCCSG